NCSQLPCAGDTTPAAWATVTGRCSSVAGAGTTAEALTGAATGDGASGASAATTSAAPSTSGGRSFTSITCAGAITVSQWHTFSSCRTLPGKSKAESTRSAASEMRLGSTP